jgi:phosphoribosylformylglycinamidine synthase PurS subunit
MKARISVVLKQEVLDPQGKAIQKACHSLGYPQVRDVRQGKIFEITWEGQDRKSAEAVLREIGEKLLANPVIEDFRIESIQT